MKILFTGASSFTGMHFIEALLLEGHDVLAVFSRPMEAYTGISQVRMKRIQKKTACIFGAKYGTKPFMDMLENHNFDVYCHHWSYTTNYQKLDFDLEKALQQNTLNITTVLECLVKKGCTKIAVTGSIFSGFQNNHESKLPFSPYGLSKKIQSEIFHLYGDILGLDVRTFVIPNPFGAFDNRKMASIFLEQWLNNKTAQVFIPDYIRDNIHVELLALGYVSWIQSFFNPDIQDTVFCPSGYQMSVKDFVSQFAQAMRPRLQVPCDFVCLKQNDFSQPLQLINNIDIAETLQVSTDSYWDNLARFALEYIHTRKIYD